MSLALNLVTTLNVASGRLEWPLPKPGVNYFFCLLSSCRTLNLVGDRALKRAQRAVSSLTEKIGELKKESRKLCKRLQCSTNSTQKSVQPDALPTSSLGGTPRTRRKRQLKRARVHVCIDEPSIKKRLLFANTISAEIKECLKANKKTEKFCSSSSCCGR